MSNAALKLIQNIVPGDRLDLDDLDDAIRTQFLDEFEGMGYVLLDGVVGEVDICTACDGEGLDKKSQRGCIQCDGMSMTVDCGRGKKPFYE